MNRERNINRIFIISAIISSALVITLLGVMIARASNKSKENSFAKDLSEFDVELLDSESASTEIGKSVEEEEEDENEEEKSVESSTDIENNGKEKEIENTIEENKIVETVSETEENTVEKKEKNKTEETGAEAKIQEKMEFVSPVKGEIIREFAKDSFVFSNTLQEWITHNGVDIKADKTSVVKAAEAGTVTSIKNDPRYGLTVIINHDNGYQTIYSNLLTSEFVVRGEKVEKGQSIGTVGNTASFEISDEPHLHFELLQNNEYLDPTIYMNFE